MSLTPKQQRFVEEYLIDLNATQAAIRAGYAESGARTEGARLLANANIADAIVEAQTKVSERTEITQDMVLKRWWEIATADPNALIQFRRNACRYCYGEGHAWQWRDNEEFTEALTAATKANKPLPSDIGGFGYSAIAEPNPECPKCEGEGIADIHAADTRHLTGGARLLYAGVKQTRDGFEIKMQDQGKALENVARHLGMFKDVHEITGKGGGPVQTTNVTIMLEEARRLGIDPAALGL